MATRLQVFDADYRIDDGNAVVRLFGKSRDGNVMLQIRDFQPYFYAVPSKIEKARKDIETGEFSDEGEVLQVEKVEEVEMTDLETEKKMLKVYTLVPPDVPKLKSEVEKLESVQGCREYDIPFYKRFLIDQGIYPVTWLEVEGETVSKGEISVIEVDRIEPVETSEELELEMLAFDLEVYEDEIIMASVYSGKRRKLLASRSIDLDFVEVVEDEKQLIERLKQVIEEDDADVVTGYNTDEFDFKVLRKRARHHGLELDLGRNGEKVKFDRRGRFSAARLKGRMHLDIYPFVAHILGQGIDSATLDLDSVAEEFLGRNKDEMSWEEMKKSWRSGENLEKFAHYALKDAELAYELGQELLPQVFELSRITGLIPFDACRLTYGQLTENYLLREAHERGMVAANRPSRSERSNRRRKGAYSGGFVYTPEPGLYENIALLDFRSLYPTVMVSHNISPDTLDRESCEDRFTLEDFDYDFCQDEQGFFPELVEELVEDRYRLKEEMRELDGDSQKMRSLDARQRAEKILANSFYGYLGYDGARWYSRECAEATTLLGRKYIQDAIERAEEQGFEVVYGDTDSLFVRGDDVRERIDGFLAEVNRELPSFMELEFEGFFSTGFFTSLESGEGAKKKYALMDSEGGMKITGFEQVRRDWSPVAKKTQKKVLENVLNGKIEQAAELVKETVERTEAGEIPVDELRIYTELTKKPENYGSKAPHVEAAKKAMKRGADISPGDTIDYVITRGGGSISDRAEMVRYADSYDAEYYIDNQIVPVAHRVLKVFGYTEDELKGKGRQTGLGSFG